MLSKLSIRDFMAKTASNSPVPGGGSMAALSSAAAASLAEMVANLTTGRKEFKAVDDKMQEAAKKAYQLREKLIKDIDRDSEAFNHVMAAFRLGKANNTEKLRRTNAIQEALKNAALVPLNVAEKAFEVMQLTEFVILHGNKNAATDGAVGAMMAKTGVLSALYNVKINLQSIKDNDFVKKISYQAKQLEAKAVEKEKQILSYITL